MKVINSNDRFIIYGDSVQTYNELPAITYSVRFDKMTGFYLEAHSPLDIKEDKIYGTHITKVNKVLKSLENSSRNLGVILSGNKGIGKSLFAKLLSNEAAKKGIPTIIVDSYYPEIASYIENIEQEVMVLFDEFDKTFGSVRAADGMADPQTELLSLFDGTASGKKMFVITCNDLSKLNDYLVNRPGRFHYHFRFDYPTHEEIKTYLLDKLDKSLYSEIDSIVSFSRKVKLNYDCLRAIVFELNTTGEKFETAINDLNILNIVKSSYDVIMYFTDGTQMTCNNTQIDLFDSTYDEHVYLYDNNGNDIVTAFFNCANCQYDPSRGCMIVNSANIKLEYDEDFNKELVDEAKSHTPSYMSIKVKADKKIHYAV